MKPHHPVDGQSVVITGAASGIGRALAQHLAGRGCPVALADVDEAGLAETARSLQTPTSWSTSTSATPRSSRPSPAR